MPVNKMKVTNPPQQEQPNPYLPPGPKPLMFEDFAGINTSTTRPGVDDKQMFWCDGFFPIAHRQLRTLPGVGPKLWSVPSGTIEFFDFVNIGPNPFAIAVISDGSLYQISTLTGVATLMAPAGTILNPNKDNVGISQYGNKYVIIVAKQTNGYFVWDGTIFYQAGTLSPVITITNAGTGYINPTVTASGGSGSGATFHAVAVAGSIVSVVVTNPGMGYKVGDTITLTFGNGNGDAVATVSLMPFGVSGTSVETYAGRVWVSDGPVLFFSAPGSIFDFSSASGGGNTTSVDSFLRVQYTQLLQTNGFLYTIADSSINYISGVQLVVPSVGSPFTTFTNTNADPEVGTPWSGTVDTFGRSIIFANSFGVHVAYGGAVTKISEALDGVYNTAPTFNTITPSSAKAIIFGKKVWMVLLPILDPITLTLENEIFIWNGKDKWFCSGQDIVVTFLQSQEINSYLTAWGTDGSSIYPLFQKQSTGFEKIVQSKFWDAPGGYQFTKTANRLWSMWQYNNANQISVDISIDNEKQQPNYTTYVMNADQTVIVVNIFLVVIPVVNVLGNVIPVVNDVGGIVIQGPTAVGQTGVLTGLTMKTSDADVTLISAMFEDAISAYRG